MTPDAATPDADPPAGGVAAAGGVSSAGGVAAAGGVSSARGAEASAAASDAASRWAAAAPPGWTVTWCAQTGSTNADLAASMTAAHGAVLVTDYQATGRGRLGRSWVAPPGSALLFSVRLGTGSVPVARRSWAGAIVGLAVTDVLRRRWGLAAGLKWPNDVLVSGAKIAGVLGEMVGDDVVVGCGINVMLTAADLPRADATSLRLSGVPEAALDRRALLAAILVGLHRSVDAWLAAGGDVDASGIRADYLGACDTIGTAVTVQLPDGGRVAGRAVDVARDGSIGIAPADGGPVRYFAAGDVTHLRPATPRALPR